MELLAAPDTLVLKIVEHDVMIRQKKNMLLEEPEQKHQQLSLVYTHLTAKMLVI